MQKKLFSEKFSSGSRKRLVPWPSSYVSFMNRVFTLGPSHKNLDIGFNIAHQEPVNISVGQFFEKNRTRVSTLTLR
jgi:hypothetical protein